MSNNSQSIKTVEGFSEQKVQTLLWLGDQIPGGFFIYRADESQEILYVNQAAMRIFGCSDEEQFRALTGYTFRGMVHPEDVDVVQASIDQQIEDAGNNCLDYVEYRVIRRDGEIRWVEDYGHFANMPGYGNVYYVFISDVTAKRLMEQEKQELVRIRHLNEMKNNFLFNMSHDIRTPMNAIIGFSELAKRHIHEPELLEEYLDKTISSGKQLLEIIDDILEMNRLESDKVMLSQENADLREQITMVVNTHQLDAQVKGISLLWESDLSDADVLMDQTQFRRIISSLLSNAIKFTPAGGTVTVTARQEQAQEPGYARYVIQVKDTGIGISQEFLKRMYDAFERETTSTKAGTTGTGLGLPIVKKILQLMGGTISCQSEKGKGTIFTIELPLKLAKSEPKASAEEKEEMPAAKQYRILIVEDIEFNRELAEELLTETGFLVESVPDGSDAVEAVSQHPAGYYDLVLMDIQMPIMNGYEATRAIRALQREDAASLPIIALSANAQETDKRMSLESGMNSHVAKPYDIDNLVNHIHIYIGQGKKPCQ